NFENREEVHNVLCNIRETNYDARKLIDEVKKICVIRITKSELEHQCQNLEKNLEIYQNREEEIKRNWGFLFSAIETMKSLQQSCINLDIIYDILHILKKHIPYLS